jgi:uncharacterized protein (TIGR00156 family)
MDTSRFAMKTGRTNGIGGWTLGVAVLLALVLSACASMQASLVSVAEAQAVEDGSELIVEGKIIQTLGEEDYYLVRDITGEITARIDESVRGNVELSSEAVWRLQGIVRRSPERSVLEVRKLSVVR